MRRGLALVAINLAVFLSQNVHAENLNSVLTPNSNEVEHGGGGGGGHGGGGGGGHVGGGGGGHVGGGGPVHGGPVHGGPVHGGPVHGGGGPVHGGGGPVHGGGGPIHGGPIHGGPIHGGPSHGGGFGGGGFGHGGGGGFGHGGFGGWRGHHDMHWGVNFRLGGYWGNNYYSNCYSNYYGVASFASALRADADALMQYDSEQFVQSLASNLSNSANNLYNLLASCVSDQVDYSTVLDSFDMVSDDFDALMNEAGDNYDLSRVAASFNSLAVSLQ